MSDIVERLRSERRLAADQIDELIAEILRLRAENEKLRAALEPFTGYAIDDETPDDEYTSLEGLTIGQLRAAAAALKETGDE